VSRESAYFQFPICLLAFGRGTEWSKRIDAIIDYSIIEFAIANEIVGKQESSGRPTVPVTIAKREEVIEKLRDRLGFSGGKLENLIENWSRCAEFISAYQKAFPRSLGLVRMRTDICWDSRNGTDGGLSEREFRILAAIYSAIGQKQFSQITRDAIINRAAGCVSRAVFSQWGGKAPAYSAKEVCRTVDDLEAAGWFRTCVFNRRQKFFTHSLTDAELRAMVIEFKTRSNPIRERRRQLDDEMTKAVLAARQSVTASGGPN
jgi:hypothetical protein